VIPELEIWLRQATRHLSRDSAAQVRTEIRDHFESAREMAVSQGATTEEAGRMAVTALGDAKAANCQYRGVLLTSAEARIVREGSWEAQAVCSHRWVKWMLMALPVAALFAAAACYRAGDAATAQLLLAGGTVMALLGAAPFLPLYTLRRGRIFRVAKWIALAAILGLAFRWSWLLFSCLWPLVWVEWTRISIRRKLPVAKWPKQLYL